MIASVIKRNKTTQVFDPEKVNKVCEWACEGFSKVSPSQIIMKAKLKFFEGMTTMDIHDSMIKSASELISEKESNYQYVAARLLMFKLRKEAYGKFTPDSFYEHIVKLVDDGRYDSSILSSFTEEEIKNFELHIDNNKDMDYSYAAVRQWQRKYLIQDRTSGKVYESPQYALMLISMLLFAKSKNRNVKIVDFYQALSDKKISLPTPIMGGLRSITKQGSSCVLIESGDSLDSIKAATGSIVDYVSRRAGIGLNVGAIRAEGEPIRGGEAVHTGLIPFLKMFQAAVGSCSQGALRKGAATVNYPIWHLEFENLVVLKNNRGVEENRVRHMDYCIHLNKLFYQRLINGQDITFFSPNVADGALYDLFYRDEDAFYALYEQLEKDPTIRKKVKSATEVFITIMSERSSTGRIYLMNTDHVNNYGAFDKEVAPVRMSNLCNEITLPTAPVHKDETGEIALCTLAAFNLGEVKYDELNHLAEMLVEALDNLLDYQEYPMFEAEYWTKARRSLGVGVTNYAYWLAKNNARYSDGSGNQITHELFERLSYALIRASNKLAVDRGACAAFGDTLYSKGIMPVDNYCKAIDDYAAPVYKCDWDALRESVKAFGMRNSTLMALMPSETSSVISNATNGIEPARSRLIIKDSSDGLIKQVLPEIERLSHQYETAWEVGNNTGYLTLTGIMQKFVDQAISVNTYYVPTNFEGDKVPVKTLLQDLIHWYKLGNKTMYYQNTYDGNDQDMDDDEGCAGGGCKI